MWKLALRNVFRQKLRTAMTLTVIVIGTVGLNLSGGFVHDIFRQLAELLIHSQSGHLQIARQGYFESGTRSPEKFLIEDPLPLRQAITTVPGVRAVMGRLYLTGLLNNGRSDMPVLGEGVEAEGERALGTSLVITAGRALEHADQHGIMVGHGLAQALKLKPGDWTTLVLNTSDGALNSMEFQVVGVFQSFSKEYDARAIRIPLAAAQSLLTTGGVNTLVVLLDQTGDTARVAAALRERQELEGTEVSTWLELNEFYTQTVEMYDAQFGVLRLIILIMVLLSVANSVNMSIYERVGEFGTMMALGNRSGRVFMLILTENLVIGALGALIGTLLSVLLAAAISQVGIPMPPPPNSDLPYTARITLTSTVVASAFAIGMLTTIAAALLPALKIRRIPVVEALRQSI